MIVLALSTTEVSEAGKIYPCGRFRIMTHAFADYRQRYTLGFGSGCPAVTSHIECQGHSNTYHSRDDLEAMVDVICGIAIAASLVYLGFFVLRVTDIRMDYPDTC